jgi:hypothetical protein
MATHPRERADELESDEPEEPCDDHDDAEEDREAEDATPQRRCRRRAPGEAEQLAAFRAGRACYQDGQTDPPGQPEGKHPDLVRHWQAGWRVAAAEAIQGRGVVVTTPYAPETRSLVELQATYRHWQRRDLWDDGDPRDHFPACATDMHDLIGTTWRNIHTASAVEVGPVLADRWGSPHLCGRRWSHEEDRPQRYRQLNESIGIWMHGHYAVEHWVRVDHWAPADAIQWYVLAVAVQRDHIAAAQRRAAEIRANWHTTSCASFNLRLAETTARRHTEQLAVALRELHAFADEHGLLVTTDIANGIPFRRPRDANLDEDAHDAPPEQLALF